MIRVEAKSLLEALNVQFQTKFLNYAKELQPFKVSKPSKRHDES